MKAKEEYTFLAIDDDPGDLELLGRQFEEFGDFDVNYIAVGDMQAALSVLAETAVDIIFLDYVLGGENGIDVACKLKEEGFSQPVILLTGHGNESIAIDAIRAGVSDYVIKGFQQSNDLLRAIINAIEKSKLEQKIVDDKDRFEELSIMDDLTGLYNRRYLFETFAREIKRWNRTGQPFSIMMLDLDHFKEVNDEFGHPTGDMVLSMTAQKIKENLRESDMAFRYGGEEFCLMLIDTHLDMATVMAERLRVEIEKTEYLSVETNKKIRVTTSIGIAEFDDTVKDPMKLIGRADHALYNAKEAGRNQVVAYTEKS